MRSNTNLLTRLLALGCLIPLTISTMVYAGFTTNYTRYVFSPAGFETQYNNGVYKYRVLGKSMLLQTYEIIKKYRLPTLETQSLLTLDERGDPRFYSAYFYLNTFFLCLTSITLFFVLGGHHNLDFIMVDLPIISMSLLMGITQYVVVPYDTLSYFLLALAALLICRGKQTVWNTLALCFVIILATLARETSALILAFYVAVNHKTVLARPKSLAINQSQITCLLLILAYFSTYAGLRYMYMSGNEHLIYQTIRGLEIDNPFSVLGVMFFGSTVIIISITQSVTRSIAIFYIASLPYIFSILLFALPWEIRLWVPIVLLVLILKVKAAQGDEKRIRQELVA